MNGISNLATSTANHAQFLKAKSLATDWIDHHPRVYSFSQKGTHRSLYPVFPIGTPIYISLFEFIQEVEQQFCKEKPIQEISRRLLNLPLRKKTLQKFKKKPKIRETIKDHLFWNKNQLIELERITKQISENNSCNLKLNKKIKSTYSWISALELSSLLKEVEHHPAVQCWMQNSIPYVCLSDLKPKDLSTFTSQKKAAVLIGMLKIKVCRREELDLRYSAVVKCTPETSCEILPLKIGRLLKLDQSLVPSGFVTLPKIQLISHGSIHHKKTLYLQPFISKGSKISSVIYKKRERLLNISLVEVQEAAIFSALTHQADLHTNNAYIHQKSDGNEHLALFDIGRSCYPKTSLIKKNNGQHALLFSSFFLAMPQVNTPLNQKTAEKITNWKLKEIKATLLKIAKREQITPILNRIFQLKQMVKEGKYPSIYTVYKNLFPTEMTFLIDLFSHVYQGNPLPKNSTVESVIEDGENNGTLSKEKAASWRSFLFQTAFQNPPISDWVYKK